MERRDALRILAGAIAVPALAGLSPERLSALAAEVHRRARGAALRVLDPRQSELVATIAERIIPATDTPGARAARVHEFIDLLLAEWADAAERDRFLRGLAEVDERSRAAHGRAFLNLEPAQQVAQLAALDAELTALREAEAETDENFFRHMKWLTVYGYYTSEIGVTQELKDPVIPGRYDPCVATGIGSWGGA